MSENIKYAIAALESWDFGRIINLCVEMEGNPDAKEVYEYLEANRPELLQSLMFVKDIL